MQRKVPVKVDGDDLLPLFVFEVFQQHGWRSGPGVIEQYIESAKVLFCLGKERGNGLGIADVGGHRQHAGIRSRQRGGLL